MAPRLPPSKLVSRTRSIFQGGPDGPIKCNIIMDRALALPSLALCKQRGWGYPIDHHDLRAPGVNCLRTKRKMNTTEAYGVSPSSSPLTIFGCWASAPPWSRG
eukprot:1203685-Pyramimonas_sp.AAC.1